MGWAAGLQSGLQIGNALKQGQLRDALAEESKKYNVTEGAFGQGLQTNIDQLRAMQQENPDQAQQYEPAIAELTRRVGLTAPDYSVNSGGQNYASMQEAQQAVAPLRTAGLANVYRQHGDIAEAENLGARAQQQQLAGLQINEATRKDVLAKKTEGLDKDYGDWMSKRLVGEDGSYRAPTFDDNIAGAQYRASQFIKAGLPDQALAQQKDFAQAASAQIQLQDHVRRQAIDSTVSRLSSGDLEAAKDFYHKFVPDGANVTNVVKNKDGTISVERETLAGQKLPPTTLPSVKSLMQSIVGMADGKAVLAYAQQEFDNNVKLQTLDVQRKSANATAGLSNERLSILKEERENREKAGKIADQYEALTEAEKNGPQGAGLIRQYNMTNAKAGGQVSLGAQARPGQTMTDIEKENLRAYRDWEKDDRNARLPQADKDKKATQMGVYNFVNPTANVVQSGLGSNPYANTGEGKSGAGKQEGVQTKAPKLTSMNTRLLGRAGDMGYNVELPNGTTRVMEKDELEDLGYRFPSR